MFSWQVSNNPIQPDWTENLQQRSILGEGASAVSFLCRLLSEGDREENGENLVVVKQYKHSMVGANQSKLWREIEILESLDHPRIPSYLGSFISKQNGRELLNLVVEYIEGVDLSKAMQSERWTLRDSLDIVMQLLAIVAYLQELQPAILHRDIKPSNILLQKKQVPAVEPKGSQFNVFLIDFGTAIDSIHDSLGVTNNVGTIGYMSIEQLQGYPTKSSDVYSIGVVAWELFTRRRAKDHLSGFSFNWQRLARSLPNAMYTWLEKMLAQEASLRYASASSALLELQSIVQRLDGVWFEEAQDVESTTKGVNRKSVQKVEELHRPFGSTRQMNAPAIIHQPTRADWTQDAAFEWLQILLNAPNIGVTDFSFTKDKVSTEKRKVMEMIDGASSPSFLESETLHEIESESEDEWWEIGGFLEEVEGVTERNPSEQNAQKALSHRDVALQWLRKFEDYANHKELEGVFHVLHRIVMGYPNFRVVEYAQDLLYATPNGPDLWEEYRTLVRELQRLERALSILPSWRWLLRKQKQQQKEALKVEMIALQTQLLHANTTWLQFVCVPPAKIFSLLSSPRKVLKNQKAEQFLHLERSSIQMIEVSQNSDEQVWLSAWLVTQELFQEVMGFNPSVHSGYLHPVENVSWMDAVIFCNRLSAYFGLQPVYQIHNSEVVRLKGDGFSLPFWSDWKLAAKSGQLLPYAGSSEPYSVGWIEKSVPQTQRVATKTSNNWGFYDMTGNVAEWCEDQDVATSHRLIAGGSFRDSIEWVRIDAHSFDEVSGKSCDLGFRIARYLNF